MSKRSKPLPLLEAVTVEAVAAEGNCLLHANDMVVFVPFCVPGDVVDVQITRKKHRYCEGRVVRLVKPSPKRVEPLCPHFGVCGGCRWQILPYEEQLRAKQQQVEDQLHRIGKVQLPPCQPILGSVQTERYRNKLDFGCCSKRWFTSEELQDPSIDLQQPHPCIGFHISGAFDKIYPITDCHLMDDVHNKIRNDIAQTAQTMGITFYDVRAQHGLLRDIIFRHSNMGEWMLILQFHYDEEGDAERAQRLMQHIVDTHPEVTSLLFVDNQKGNDTLQDLTLTTFYGTPHIFETMENLRFKVGPKSFYQTNTQQAYHLYCVARQLAFQDMDVTARPLVYDLYTGTGTIANFVASRASKVVGIEYVPEAIEDAKENSRINGISNTLFYAGDMKNILTDDFIAEHGKPDIIITDPPRAGMHQDVIDTIVRAAPNRIVYVSCNPATQARDLALLDAHYVVRVVQPVDMFPHTPHVENVVMLERRTLEVPISNI